MKIKILATGSSKWERFIRRWGVSFLIDEDVLFDTFGDPGVLLNNMRRFGVGKNKIKHIVLSHDDWDHIGGLWYLINHRKDIAVYICPGFGQDIKERIASFGVRVVEVDRLTQIKEGIFSSGPIQTLREGRLVSEQALVLKFIKKLTVVTGCAHPGIINIIDVVQRSFVKEKVFSILGGLHLKDTPMPQIDEVILALKARGISQIAPTHCTGQKATQALKIAYGVDFREVKAGTIMEI